MTLAGLSPWANHLWQSTLFAAVAWLLTLTLRKNRAAVRYWIWLAASVKFLIPFAWLAGVGASFHWRAAPVAGSVRIPVLAAQIGQPFEMAAPVALPSAAVPVAHLWPVVLLSVWLCGIALGLVFWVRSHRRMDGILRGAKALDLNLPIPVLAVPGRMEPGVLGIWKPVLLLPEGITERLTPGQLEAILAHELRHVHRRDNLTAAIHMLVETVFWFHPAVWWIRKRLVEERERACDEGVLRLGSEPQVYAESILKVCEFYLSAPVALAAGVTGGELKKRIEGIMENRFGLKMGFGKRALLATAALAATALPLALGVLHATVAFTLAAQTPAGKQEPVKFDAATIKLDQLGPGPRGLQGGPGTGSPGRVTWGKVWLRVLIAKAFRVNFENVSGPGWMSGPSFIGGGGGQLYLLMATMPPETSEHDFETMLQNFLIEQFQIKLHHEPRNFPAYDLVVMPGGPKLKAAANPDGPDITFRAGEMKNDSDGFPVLPPGHGVLFTTNDGNHGRYQSFTMSEFAESAAGFVTPPGGTRHYVRDKTGLTGKYDFNLAFDPAGAGGDVTVGPGVLAEGGRPPEPEVAGLPNFSRAIEKQLGLRLVKGPDIPMDTLVIDHAERIPLGN